MLMPQWTPWLLSRFYMRRHKSRERERESQLTTHDMHGHARTAACGGGGDGGGDLLSSVRVDEKRRDRLARGQYEQRHPLGVI
jgi:hypothetical protein